jgi:hypothetical protein
VTRELFTSPQSLHLTLGVMRLFRQSEIDAAVAELKAVVAGLRESCFGAAAPVIRVAGIEYMNDDPAQVCG